MKGKHGLLKGTTLLAISLLTLMTSCRNLKDVEEFGQSSVIVNNAVKLVSKDVYKSCLRTARQYRRPTEGSTIFPAASSFEVIKQAEKACDMKKEDASMIANANATLTNYMEGLGRLASGDTVQFDKNLDALEASITGLTGLIPNSPNQEINAGLKIARFIFNQFTLAFRRENIKEAILCADESISEYTEGLKFIAQEYYIDGTLRNERAAMDNYYQSLKPDIFSQTSQASERIATFLLRRQYGEELAAFSAREQAAQEYIQLLSETANTHHNLHGVFASAKNMNEQELKNFCKPIFLKKDSLGAMGVLPSSVSSVLTETEMVMPVSKTLSLTPAESEAIVRILKDYRRRAEPLAIDIARALSNN